MEPGRGGGAVTGHRAESAGLMLKEPRFRDGPATAGVAFPFGPTLSRLADSPRTVRLSARRLSSRVTVSADSAVESEVTAGVLRRTRIGRGDQSAGWTSQSCLRSFCCCTARAEALLQP